MKPRNKEVNIFNMSLLDILCGALGAFCFLMLVLFQYWKPEGPDAVKAKENSAQLEKQVQELLRQMKGMSNVPPEMASRLQQMERQFGALQAEVGRLRSMVQGAQAQSEAHRRQAQQAQQQLKNTQEENNKLRGRNPITVVLTNQLFDHDVDLYVQDPKMDPPVPDKIQGKRWNGDVFYNLDKGAGSDVWMMRDAPPQEYRIHYKFLARNSNPQPAKVWGYFLHNNRVLPLPVLDLPTDRRSYFVGAIVVRPDYSSTFRPSSEFEAAYREVLQRWRIPPESLNAPPVASPK